MHRDEVLDGRTRISGYRFRPASMDGNTPTAPAKANALKADNLAAFAQRRMAIVPIDAAEWLGGDFRQFATPNTLFALDVPPPGKDVAAWQAALADIKASGAKVGLDSAAVSARCQEAFKLADAIVVKFGDYPIDALDRLVGYVRSHNPDVAVVADGVYSWPDYRSCIGMGAHYCVGDFASAADADDKPQPVSQSRLILVKMLNMLRNDAKLADLAALAKRDPGVAVRILEMANSPLAGLHAAVASIDQAIMVLGREALYRWLTVAIFRAGNGQGRDETLLEIALRRARFLELCGKSRLPKTDSDELFVLGLMSLMDKLFALPMAQVLAQMPLPRQLSQVLLDGDGPYADYFRLALGVEKGPADLVARLAAALEMDVAAVLGHSSAARAWAEQSLALG